MSKFHRGIQSYVDGLRIVGNETVQVFAPDGCSPDMTGAIQMASWFSRRFDDFELRRIEFVSGGSLDTVYIKDIGGSWRCVQ